MAGRRSPSDQAARFQSLYAHGFVRVAAAAPVVAPAEPAKNAARIEALWREADAAKAALLLTPELSLSGYAIDDLLLQDALLDAVEDALTGLKATSEKLSPVLVVGAPLRHRGSLYNCAVALHRGRVLGVVPKSFLPNYREFYEKRHFAVAEDVASDAIQLGGEEIPFGANLVFAASDAADCVFHIEICEDLWAPTPPSTLGALAGATILLNLSASNITIGKAEDRKALCDAQSRRCNAAYVFAAAGYGESTTDLSWDGQIVIYEMGEKLVEAERFQREPKLHIADLDVGRCAQERQRLSNFRDAQGRNRDTVKNFRRISFTLDAPMTPLPLQRAIDRFPFVPDDETKRDRDCYEAYNIQVQGLAQRLESTGIKRAVIGVSGGIDSTHALIVTARAFDLLGLPRENIIGVTMPGFATGEDSKASAISLMRALKIDAREISIVPMAQQMLEALNHPAAKGAALYDVTFENVQAGLRTDYLFRLANKEGGLVIGTGDLSESALGWQTYGVGDHMSHYNVNAGAPKTLIQHLIRWVIASKLFDEKASATLQRVVDAEISPELVPGETPQSTQAIVGPYDLQDFNLYWITRYGFKPSKVLFLAWSAWGGKYDYATIRHWLGLFVKRFFQGSQFKRSAMPNGPKIVSGGALSPRGDWRAPSDGNAAIWLEDLARTPEKLP